MKWLKKRDFLKNIFSTDMGEKNKNYIFLQNLGFLGLVIFFSCGRLSLKQEFLISLNHYFK